MDSLIDYILWMSEIPISATGFRDADALVLCYLSYYDLNPVFESGSKDVCLRDCLQMIDEGKARLNFIGKRSENTDILKAAASSARFGNLRMTDYEDISRAVPPLQFAAVCFHDESGLSFISYRGTDASLAGWQEDFMISFTNTEAQELGRKYAGQVITADRRWMIGGHSKGGNLALYASCLLPDDKLESVEKIYILDGPGLCSDVMDLSCIDRIRSKTVSIAPEFSVIGKLFELDLQDRRIVRSSAIGPTQHDASTWGIDHGKLALAESHAPVSIWINDVIDRWAMNITQEERVLFVNEVFDTLRAGGAETIEELYDSSREAYEKIRDRFRNLSETTRRILTDLPRQAIVNSLSSKNKQKQEK